MSHSSLEKIGRSALSRVVKEAMDWVFGRKTKKHSPGAPPQKEPRHTPPSEIRKSHPWRLCPIGEHWRRTHPRKTGVSESNPDGLTTVRGHCVRSPNGKETFHPEELREIARLYFGGLRADPSLMPGKDDLGFKTDGNHYDTSIAGWTKFWNETLSPKTPLDPDWVKALVASESGFRPKIDTPSKEGISRGLVQITESTRRILGNTKGELRNHYIHVDPEDLFDPDVNLASGIRWLHHKKFLLEHRLKRETSWEEAILEYKGITRQIGKVKRSADIEIALIRYFRRLKK